MMHTSLLLFLLLVPTLGAVIGAFMPGGRAARAWGLLVSLATAAIAVARTAQFDFQQQLLEGDRIGSMAQSVQLTYGFGLENPMVLPDIGFAFKLGVDSIGLPENLPSLLSPGPAYLESQPVVGHWPAGTVDELETLLLAEGKHSMLSFAEAIGATAVKIGGKPANINTPADLTAAEKTHGI